MAFGIYIHIPYCLQRCTYCDFATYEKSQIMPPSQYLQLLKKEIEMKSSFVPTYKLDTIYFGGGTPSLLPAEDIVSILQMLSSVGFETSPQTEITIEINPATIHKEKMETYLKNGFNRFSVGAQTFNDALLKSVKREHNSKQTLETLKILHDFQVQYSFDLLFALPGQTLDILKHDLDHVLKLKPHHVSPYCLTVPEGHILSKNLLKEDLQIQMFQEISKSLLSAHYEQYEISNFCRDSYFSKHNCLYWDDQEYWGIGLSAHSYFKNTEWGTRFWNPNSIQLYKKYILELSNKNPQDLFEAQATHSYEKLLMHQSITDYCHTSLRRKKGLEKSSFIKKYSDEVFGQLRPLLAQQVENGFLRNINDDQWQLTPAGILLSNQVFASLTFLDGDLS